MQHSTPFFQGFSSIPFGRPALSGLQEKLREVAALNTLSDFFATLSQKAGCGFPQMRIVGLFSLACGARIDFAKSSIHVHERQQSITKGFLSGSSGIRERPRWRSGG
jgi:hypothetical protein